MSERKRHLEVEGATPERYTWERVTVEALTTPWEAPGKLKSFPWPLELHGKGLSNEKDKTMILRFPNGDILLSYVTTIHELGHLRQEELDPTLKREKQTHKNLVAQEQDAWERGWDRFKKSNPELLKTLEKKFQSYRTEGKLQHASFRELYDWVRQNILQVVEVERILFDASGEETHELNEERFDALADALEQSGFRDFLEQFALVRVGETVNENEIREAVHRTIEDIMEE